MTTEKITFLKDLTAEFLGALAIDFSSIEVTEEEKKTWINIVPQDDASLVIGYRGGNLLAFQHLIKNFFWAKGVDRDIFIIVDIDGYKKKNEVKILTIAREKAAMVEQTGFSQVMPFLSPSDRRIVHLEISLHFTGVITESFTDEEGKRVLKMKKAELASSTDTNEEE